MLRSAASRLVSSACGAVRLNMARSMSHGVGLAPPSLAKYGDGKTIHPSNEGVTGPDPSYLPGERVVYPDYEDCEGTKIPGPAWSDGQDRVIWDKLPPPLMPNPTIMYRPAKETDDELDKRYLDYFNREDIDGWELRKALGELHKEDLIPEPAITIAAFKAMRRLNEFPMTIRWLECLHWKCGPNVGKIWPWMMQELGPTMQEMGIPTLEEMGYDKPELWQESVYDM